MVTTQHPQYSATVGKWREARHVIAGGRVIKQCGEIYLPRLIGDSNEAYDQYRDRAVFFNATGRTLDGFVGLIFRRDPFVLLPKGETRLTRACQAFVNDTDLAGTPLTAYAKWVTNEVIAVGRCGTMVDWSNDEERAYVTPYRAEQIINWRFERVNGRMIPTLVVLMEPQQVPDPENYFEVRMVDQIRVLRLVDWSSLSGQFGEKPPGRQTGRPMACVVDTWRRVESDWVKDQTRVPLRAGKPLPLLPFIFHSPGPAGGDVSKLPLSDLIEVNLSHYKLTADYRHGMHYAALPTAWAAGVPAGTHMPPMGSATVWESGSVEFRCGFLEFKGDGLETLERALDRDERLLAVLGSRLLEPAKRVGETAEAIELRQSGESSVLASLAGSVSDSLTAAMRWVYWWHSGVRVPDEVQEIGIELNMDFSSRSMTPAELRELVGAFQAQVITQEELLDALRRGEVIAPNSRREIQ